MKTFLTKGQHMRNHKAILSLEETVILDKIIKVTLLPKRDTITLVMDIKITRLIKEDRETSIILYIKLISNIELFKF